MFLAGLQLVLFCSAPAEASEETSSALFSTTRFSFSVVTPRTWVIFFSLMTVELGRDVSAAQVVSLVSDDKLDRFGLSEKNNLLITPIGIHIGHNLDTGLFLE